MSEIAQLVVLNDNVNTFSDIIAALHEYCDCNEIQAEQLAYIIHNNGQAIVKTDLIECIEYMQKSLSLVGINSTINQL